MDAFSTTLVWLDYAAVAVFGASGALAGARRKHDIVTFGFFAAVTGVGGGTMRDLILDAPVFWVAKPEYLATTLLAALAVWVFGAGRWRMRILLWLDAVGMAGYAIVGAAKATALGAPPLSAMVMGVLTACFGGIIRDILAHEPSVLLRREVYVTCAVVGAGLYLLLLAFGMAHLPAGLIGGGAAFLLRSGAILWGWSLPGFPGRADPQD